MAVCNPVEILIETRKHPEETVRAGRLVDLTGEQFRYIIDEQSLKPGTRYDVDVIQLDQKTVWITNAWEWELLLSDHDQ